MTSCVSPQPSGNTCCTFMLRGRETWGDVPWFFRYSPSAALMISVIFKTVLGMIFIATFVANSNAMLFKHSSRYSVRASEPGMSDFFSQIRVAQVAWMSAQGFLSGVFNSKISNANQAAGGRGLFSVACLWQTPRLFHSEEHYRYMYIHAHAHGEELISQVWVNFGPRFSRKAACPSPKSLKLKVE